MIAVVLVEEQLARVLSQRLQPLAVRALKPQLRTQLIVATCRRQACVRQFGLTHVLTACHGVVCGGLVQKDGLCLLSRVPMAQRQLELRELGLNAR